MINKTLTIHLTYQHKKLDSEVESTTESVNMDGAENFSTPELVNIVHLLELYINTMGQLPKAQQKPSPH